MQLTRAADYAVRVMIHLAGLPPAARANRASLAEAVGVPEHFLGKVLLDLARCRLVVSRRGVHGGYELALPAEQITLLRVVEAMEGPVRLNFCLEEGETCDRRTWCGAHRVWAEAQAAMVRVLRAASIASLARETAVNRDFVHTYGPADPLVRGDNPWS